MRKTLLILWAVDSVALAWLFGYILLHGNDPDSAALAGDLGAIWGGLAGVCGWMLWKARKHKASI